MKRKEKIISDKFILELKQITLGYFTAKQFDLLVESFEKEISKGFFTPSAESNLVRIIRSLYERIYFLNDCLKYPHYIQIASSISAYSNYLTDVIVRNPEFLYWVLSEETLNGTLTEEYLANEIQSAFDKFKSFASKVNMLRSIKRREILRIGLNDILGNKDLPETTYQLSILAKIINRKLFQLCHQEIENKYQIKIKEPRYCLVSLGKLGGDELNYSSDTDFILFFDKNTNVKSKPTKEYFEILNEAAYLFIQTSTAVTDRGFLYRVDFRLRPDGRTSPLCRTLKDYIQYYDTRGEDWERQMLIKMNFVGGSEKLYNSFNNYIQHFVYPTSFSSSPVSEISRIKKDIENRIGETDNVKLFSGGIRDIEFSVQALQLLNAGKIPELRTGNSLTAIDALQNHNLLSSDEAIIFKQAYHLYRKIEHFLQLMNDRQTHVIPDDEQTQDNLAMMLGLKDRNALKKKIEITRQQVKKIFTDIIGEEANENLIDSINFSDRKKSLSNFKYLQTGQGLLEQKQFDKQTINSFKRIEKQVLDFISKISNPDVVLENFARIIKTRQLTSIWYNEFADEQLLKLFLTLCGNNKKAVDLLIAYRPLGDLILSRKVFSFDFSNLENISVLQLLVMLSSQFSLGIIDQQRASEVLSEYVSKRISKIASESNLPKDGLVIGMGSLGSQDMSFNSDIDLVFLVRNLTKYSDAQSRYQEFFLRVKEELKPFDVDCRLRPEGKNSPLVWDLDSYFEYLEQRAMVWEFQALIKNKILYGSQKYYDILIKKISDVVSKFSKSRLATEITGMRSKIEKQISSIPQSNFPKFLHIKRSRGGLVDIEFGIQTLLLSNPNLFAESIGKSTIDIINSLANKQPDSFLTHHLVKTIKNGFLFLKKLELWNQVIFESSNSILPLDGTKRTILINTLGFNDEKTFDNELNNILKSNRKFYEDSLKQLELQK
ncbi:MAG: hypothetical protein C4539_03335 [Ignavibacteriales bacterium]|nr:MAG: hypothetical protein C4539_03335 [Ignavibacteriales bacterium]